MNPYEDPSDKRNGPEYHTGKKCREAGCNNPAGTAWSPFWCQQCNAKRMDRVTSQFERLTNTIAGIRTSASN